MNVLVLTNYWPPEVGAASHLTYELCTDLVGYGHAVTVVTGFPRYNVRDVPVVYRGRWIFREQMEGVQVIRVPALSSRSRVPAVRALEHFLVAAPFFLGGAAAGPADAVYCISPPLPLGLSGYLLARIRRAMLIFGVQDIYPQTAIDLGMLRHPLAIRLARGLERYIYAVADRITVHSEGSRRFLVDRSSVPASKVRVIPNWVDPTRVVPGERENDFRLAHGLSGKFVVLFAGTMGWAQGLDVVVEAAHRMRDQPEIVFVLVGDGVERARLQDAARRLGLENIRFLPMQPWREYPSVLNAADVCLVTLRPEVRTPVVPSKILTIMASGRPVIASVDPDGDAARIVREAECGVAVGAGNPEGLAAAVMALYRSEMWREILGTNGRRHVERHFARGVCTKAFEAVLHEMRSSGR